MIAQIQSSTLQGIIKAPASKSAMQRACAAALLTNGTTTIYNPGQSNDEKAAIAIITQIGAAVALSDNCITIKSEGVATVVNTKATQIDCGESGLSIRMFTPIAALSAHPITIMGHGSLENRPMDFFEKTLPILNVKVSSHAGSIPLNIKGPLQAKNIIVDGSQSSQFITGLLMTYSVIAEENTGIKVINLTSKPYIELTLGIMQHFQMNMPTVNRLEDFVFHKANSETKEIAYSVEGDWSSAAFLLVGGAINGNISIQGLNTFSAQADAAIIEVLEDCEAEITIDEEDDTIHIKSSVLKAFEFDATDCPDLFPPLVTLASYCDGISKIHGIHRLLHKESNRAQTLIEEFSKIGVPIYAEEDTLIIEGGTITKGCKVSAHNDHRIAMALAIAGLRSEDIMEIEGAASVNKSYPTFWEDLKMLGANIILH